MKGVTMYKNVRGFTLAEILITLGIIGVVASMTIPALIASYQKKQIVTKLQKATNTIMQVVNLSVAYNDFPDNWEFGDGTAESTYQFLQNYFFPYIKTVKICAPNEAEKCFSNIIYRLDGSTIDSEINKDTQVAFILADGTSILSMMDIYNEGNDDRKQLSIRIDLNGIQKPNKYGKDIFCYDMGYAGYNNGKRSLNYMKLSPCHMVQTRENLIKSGGVCSTDKTGRGIGCSALILKDGWKISKDYPW